MTYERHNGIRVFYRTLKNNLKIAATHYNEYCNSSLLFVYKNQKTKNYEMKEIYFEKKHFMHLCGVKNEALHSGLFYDKCLDGSITIEECIPSNDRSGMISKLLLIQKGFSFKNARLHNIGDRNKITKSNNFSTAIGGNGYCTLGCDIRYDKRNKERRMIPTTFLPKPINEYSTQHEKIQFIFIKEPLEEKYKTLFYEMKSDILIEEYKKFPPNISIMLDSSLITPKQNQPILYPNDQKVTSVPLENSNNGVIIDNKDIMKKETTEERIKSMSNKKSNFIKPKLEIDLDLELDL